MSRAAESILKVKKLFLLSNSRSGDSDHNASDAHGRLSIIMSIIARMFYDCHLPR
jgi:hypothetical protein